MGKGWKQLIIHLRSDPVTIYTKDSDIETTPSHVMYYTNFMSYNTIKLML